MNPSRLAVPLALAICTVLGAVRADSDSLRMHSVIIEPAPAALSQRSASMSAVPQNGLAIEWEALADEVIESASGQRAGSALQVGVHREIPVGYRGNLFDHEDLEWTHSGETRSARVDLIARGAASVRAQFRVSLPEGGALTFHGVPNEARTGPITWTAAQLVERDAAATAVWGPRADGETLTIVATVPADAALDGHFFVLTKISHRWGAGATTPPSGALSAPRRVPMDSGGSALRCPFHFEPVACYPSAYPSSANSGDLRGAVVHYHFEGQGTSGVCSGTLLAQRGSTRKLLMLTAHHCVATAAEANSIESEHYWASIDCAGSTLDPRYAYNPNGAKYLTGLHSADQTLVELRDSSSLSGLVLSGWDANPQSPPTALVYGLHHPSGWDMAFSSGSHVGYTDAYVPDYGLVLQGLDVDWVIGTTEQGSSGSGLFYDSDEAYLVGVLSSGFVHLCPTPSNYGAFSDFYPLIRAAIDPRGTEPEFREVARVPYFPREGSGAQQGFVRLLNWGPVRVAIKVDVKRSGQRAWLNARCSFSIAAESVYSFTSTHLRKGGKGCRPTADLRQDFTLRVRANASQLSVHAYAQALDGTGFVNPLAGTAEQFGSVQDRFGYYVPFINPASNRTARSEIWITNLGSRSSGRLTLLGYDDAGGRGTATARALAPRQTLVLTASDLERGARGKVFGRFGDGVGRWRLYVLDSRTKLEVVALVKSSTLTANLSR